MTDTTATIGGTPSGVSPITISNSEIQAFLDKRGGGIHHVCLEVTDVAAATAHASAQGMQLLGKEATIGAEGFPVRFAHPKSTAGALVEWLGKPGN